jgi:hypothetical protein
MHHVLLELFLLYSKSIMYSTPKREKKKREESIIQAVVRNYSSW